MNYYICPVSSQAITVNTLYTFNETLTLSYPADVSLPFKIDERVFLLQSQEQCLLPYQCSIVSINRAALMLVVRVIDIYQNSLPLEALSLFVPEPVLRKAAPLQESLVKGIISLMNIAPLEHRDGYGSSQPVEPPADRDDGLQQDVSAPGLNLLNQTLLTISDQFDTIVHLLQTQQTVQQEQAAQSLTQKQQETQREHTSEDDEDESIIEVVGSEEEGDTEDIFDEADVLEYVKAYIRQRGYYFDDETLSNYHICLKTRPFVILAGLSGTGKSQLARLYAEALGQNQTFKRLSVRPNWNDDRYLLGHLNTVTGEYMTEPALEFLFAANRHRTKLYSLCLDEMNLAHVEYYFSQFLSAMEGDRPEDRRIELMSQRAYQQLLAQTDPRQRKSLPPAEISLPDNLIFTGTINVDETTQPISDKVIDRANTIEFFNVDLEKIPEPGEPGEPLLISNKAWQSYRSNKPDTRYHALIVGINKILKSADMGLGYRVVHEIELYLANSQGLLDPLVAFDLQCKQRILPRIRGTEIIDGMLSEFITLSKQQKLSRTELRLHEMKQRLKRDGYTSFWR